MNFPSSISLAACLAVLSIHVQAAISITNFSFEDNILDDSASGAGLNGWTASNSGSFNPIDSHFTGTSGLPGTIPGDGHGQQVAYMNGGTLYQNVGTIEANSTYEMTVAIGERLDLGFNNLTIYMRASSDTGATLATQSYDASDAPNGTFSDVSFSFSSADFAGQVGNDLYLVFESGGIQVLLDNVRISETAIPEPAATALLGFGACLLLVRRRS